jgi:hypothetical protein
LYVLQGIIPPATNALIDQLLMEHAPPERRGAVSSWRNAATEAGGFAGASGGGYLLERSAFGTLLGAAGSVAVLGAGLLVFGFRKILVRQVAGQTTTGDSDSRGDAQADAVMVAPGQAQPAQSRPPAME